jgi:PAS domain S-box-containing protein
MDHPLRLLLVEDGRADAMITRALIGEAAKINGHGYDVDHAVDFAEALAYLAASADRPYDVCMLDLGLPDASGVALVAEVEKRYPQVAIVVNSGAEGEYVAEESLASGAQEFLRKGQVTPQSMALTLRNAVLRARLRTELAESEAEHRALFDFSPSPIWVLEAATMRVLRANHAACELHGYPLPQLMTMYFPELQPDEPIEDLKQAFLGLTPPKRIWRQRPQKGPAIYVQLTAYRIAVRSGEAIIVTAQRVLLGGS